MTPITALALILHVLTGLTGAVLLAALLYALLNPSASARRLRMTGWWSFVSIVLSWFTGAYYYVTYYGKIVRPVIKAGAYPWAHSVLMEAKEHLFLFLPFLTFVLAMLLQTQGVRTVQDPLLRRALLLLASVAFGLAALVTLFGVGVSGAYRP